MRRAAILLLGMLGCGGTASGPHLQDASYLKFGVDPNQEANAVIESQKARDLVLAQRQLGRHFTALGFMDRRGRSTAVRVLTARGIVIALDNRAQTAVAPAASYSVLAAPIEGTYDADKDGFEEVFVEERTPGATCVTAYRIRDVGFVDRVLLETDVWGQTSCPRAAVDLDGDGVVELVAEMTLEGLTELGGPLRMPLPLWANEHRFVARAGTGPQRAWLTTERARREDELKRARERRDVPRSYTLGVELAALEYLGGGDPAAQLAAFDRALSGLVLSPPEAAANLGARSSIYTKWNAPAKPAAAVVAQERAPEKPTAPESANASKGEAVDEPARAQQGIRLRRIQRRGPEPLPEPAPVPFWAQPTSDEPVLAEGEFIITPESAAAETAARRRARAQGMTPQTAAQPAARPAATTPAAPAPAPTAPATQPATALDRTAARDAGNAAVAARQRAAVARQAAANERREAQAARERAAHSPDPASAAEHRKAVEEHIAAAKRFADEAAAHAAEAARHREALLQVKAAAIPEPAP